jgi:hypothetical protein
MKALKIDILAYTSDWQPGWVQCHFQDAYGKDWYFEEKVPVVTIERLDENSQYPTQTVIPVEILETFQQNDLDICKIELYYDIEVEGSNIFDIKAENLIEI